MYVRKYESTKVLSYIFVVLSYDTAISISVRRYSKLLHYTYTYYDTVHIYVRCSTKVSISGSTCTVHVQYFRTTLLKPLLKIESEASLSPPPAAGVHTEHRVAYKVLC